MSSAPYAPSQLKLSPKMQKKIAADPVCETRVRLHTSKLFEKIHTLDTPFRIKNSHTGRTPFVIDDDGSMTVLTSIRQVKVHLSSHYDEIDFNALDADGDSLLHYITNHPCEKILEDILSRCDHVNLPCAAGNTPLMVACAYPQRAMLPTIKTLLDAGANPDHINHRGHCALSLVAKSGHQSALPYLIDAGANTSIMLQGAAKDLERLQWCSPHDHQTKENPDVFDMMQDWNTRLKEAKTRNVEIKVVQPEVDDAIAKTTDLLDRANRAQDHWSAWLTQSYPDRVTASQLVEFANIGKLQDAFHLHFWIGHEDKAFNLLSELPPQLSYELLTTQPWLWNAPATMNASLWTERIAPAPTRQPQDRAR